MTRAGDAAAIRLHRHVVAAAIGFTLSGLSVQAQTLALPASIQRPADASGVFAIYSGTGLPPGAAAPPWHEATVQVPGGKVPNRMVRNVVIPTVTKFAPEPSKTNGTSLIVAPGGAFRFQMFDNEGVDVAHALVPLGVTVFILRYRVAHTPDDDAQFFQSLGSLMTDLPHPGPQETSPPTGNAAAEQARDAANEDALQAIRFVRQHAAEWKLDPARIGIAGFSAGGGMAVDAAMHHQSDSRPDFVGGIYPGYRPGSITVPTDAPPLFIAATDDDVLVAPISGARLYEAWHAAGKPAELHVFASGKHGFGMMKQGQPSDAWIGLFTSWLRHLGLVTQASR